jgi:ribosomal protein S18 acetylase RimI-like enzyme
MVIREARKEDADEIARLGHIWHDNVEEENIKNTFLEIFDLSVRHFVFVAEEDSQIVGFSHWVLFRHLAFGIKIGELESIFVHPDYRKRGIGRALMLAGMKTTREVGAIEYRVSDVVPSNLPALILYEKMGFVNLTFLLGKHKADIEEDEQRGIPT